MKPRYLREVSESRLKKLFTKEHLSQSLSRPGGLFRCSWKRRSVSLLRWRIAYLEKEIQTKDKVEVVAETDGGARRAKATATGTPRAPKI